MEWLRSTDVAADKARSSPREVDFMYMSLFWLSVVLFLGIAFADGLFRLALPLQARPRDAAPDPQHHARNGLDRGAAAAVRGHLLLGPERLDEVSPWRRARPWKFRSPPSNGCGSSNIRTASRTVNELHVPVNKPVHFMMTSEDVLHDFFVPGHAREARYRSRAATPKYGSRPRVLGEHHCHLRRILRQGPLRHDRRS